MPYHSPPTYSPLTFPLLSGRHTPFPRRPNPNASWPRRPPIIVARSAASVLSASSDSPGTNHRCQFDIWIHRLPRLDIPANDDLDFHSKGRTNVGLSIRPRTTRSAAGAFAPGREIHPTAANYRTLHNILAPKRCVHGAPPLRPSIGKESEIRSTERPCPSGPVPGPSPRLAHEGFVASRTKPRQRYFGHRVVCDSKPRRGLCRNSYPDAVRPRRQLRASGDQSPPGRFPLSRRGAWGFHRRVSPVRGRHSEGDTDLAIFPRIIGAKSRRRSQPVRGGQGDF